MKIFFYSASLLLGVGIASAQVCDINPFDERTADLVTPNGSLCTELLERRCLNNPNCFHFGGPSQFPETCAGKVRVIWPSMGSQQITTVFQNSIQPGSDMNGSRFAYGPPTSLDCIPLSALSCLDGDAGDVALIFGIDDSNDKMSVDLDMILGLSEYAFTVVIPLNAYGPEPMGTCIFKTTETSFSLDIDRGSEYLVVVVLAAPNGDVLGDIVRADIEQWHMDPPPPDGGNGPDHTETSELKPGMGPNNPLAEPADHACPRNVNEAKATDCAMEDVGNCMYNFRLRGCDWDELECKQANTCDCQTFMASRSVPVKWRCWGTGPPPSCPAGSPTAHLVGQMCDPHDALPKNPNPGPPVCPRTPQPLRSCDGRIQRCEYNHYWFGCNELNICIPSTVCDCQGRWLCYGVDHTCPEAFKEGEIPAGMYSPCSP